MSVHLHLHRLLANHPLHLPFCPLELRLAAQALAEVPFRLLRLVGIRLAARHLLVAILDDIQLEVPRLARIPRL